MDRSRIHVCLWKQNNQKGSADKDYYRKQVRSTRLVVIGVKVELVSVLWVNVLVDLDAESG